MMGLYTEHTMPLMRHRHGAGVQPCSHTTAVDHEALDLEAQNQALLDRFSTGRQSGTDSQHLKALSLKRFDPTIDWLGSVPPADVAAAAEKVGHWFAERNISYWTLGPCQSRATRHSTMSIMLTPDLGAM